MDHFRLSRASTVPVATLVTSEVKLCYSETPCEEVHRIDTGNGSVRDIIQRVRDTPVHDNERIKFMKNSGGAGLDQGSKQLYLAAAKAAAQCFRGSVSLSTYSPLGLKIVRLHEALRESGYGTYCPFTLARALSEPGTQPEPRALRRAFTLPISRYLGRTPQNDAESSVAPYIKREPNSFPQNDPESYGRSTKPDISRCIYPWVMMMVGIVSVVAGGLLLVGKHPQLL